MKNMRSLLSCLVLCSFVLISGDGKLKFTSLSSGMNSTVTMQKQDIIHSGKDFAALWILLHKTEIFMGDIPPEVDFSEKSIIACYMGDQSNGMEIDSVKSSGSTITVYERKEEFEANCDDAKLLVTPFQLIEVDGTKWTKANAIVTVENIECED